jgi:diketogulonate reductase-like aldo/keto reductase
MAIKKVKMNNGIEIPLLGLGTYAITSKKEVENAINSALEAGYRLFDSAAAYYNEKEIGSVIKKSSVPRKEVFITTKLDNWDHGYDKALRAFDESLKKLDMEYVDLYLIHWPISGKRKESWKALEKIYKDGRAKSIGVSNYTVLHLKELFDYAEIIPAVNQIELNPFVHPKDILEVCRKNNIIVEAYTPLARTHKFSHPLIKELTQKYKKTAAQILLRWGVQHDAVVIPKSSHRDRIFENADIFDFEISGEDMERMNKLDENLRSSPDPNEMD